MPITSVQVSCASLKLEATFPVYPPALEIASLKKDLAQMVKLQPWRIDILQGGSLLPTSVDVNDGEFDILKLEMSVRRSPIRSISIDSKLINQISCDSLRDSYAHNLREELGLCGKGAFRYTEIALVVTDWHASMPDVFKAMLVEFLASRRDDPTCPCIVQIDLHGNLSYILEAMHQNRLYYESSASSLETLELSLANVDPQMAFLPLFPNLLALRIYKPEFPSHGTDYTINLLNVNCNSLHDIAIVGLGDARIFSHVLEILASESFDERVASTTLWMVGSVEALLLGLRQLGDHLEALRTRTATNNFLLRLGKLNLHVDDEGFGNIRTTASCALNRGLDENQIHSRPKVLTTIRSTRPATRPTDVLMCLFDITPLSLGVATARGTDLLEHESDTEKLRGSIIMAHLVGTREKLQVECSNLSGDLILSAALQPESSVADLEQLLITSLSKTWTGATFFLGNDQVPPESSLQNYDSLVVKEEKDPVMTCVIQRNTTVPTLKSKFFTAAPQQEGVLIQVLEGELPLAKDNHTVGQLHLDKLRPAFADRVLIEVSFDIDANDILHVTASDCGSGSISKASFPLDARWRASQIAMDQMIQGAESHWEEKMVIEDRSTLFDICSRALKSLQPDAAETVQKMLVQLMDERDTADDYKVRLKEVQDMLDLVHSGHPGPLDEVD